ncbi:MAG: UbiA family prenyltransferase [Deltaproteobacteria bacterium]|nr:UbiA family prenyltransferase [Deltaproteobacteria bacterium]
MSKLPALLKLMRVPVAFTAMADVMAGYLIAVAPSSINLKDMLLLMAASSAIYSGGSVLNDICDINLGRARRPERPLPSGDVSLKGALFLMPALISGGFILAYKAGPLSALTSIVLIFLAISYGMFTKERSVTGPSNMGLCRSVNLFLGMSAGWKPVNGHMILLLITFAHVFSITILRRFEKGGIIEKKGMAVAGWAGVISVLLLLREFKLVGGDALIFLTLYGLLTGLSLFDALNRVEPRGAVKGIKTMVLGIPLIDAAYTAGTHGLSYGLAVALFTIPAYLLSRFFAVA